MDSRLPKLLFSVLLLWAVDHFSYYYSQLPSVVASHFNAHGTPNGWETKQAFYVFSVATALVAFALVFAVPAFIRVTPLSLINLPNKNYWLGPQHKEESQAFLEGWFAWFGCAVFMVILSAFDFALKFNLQSSNPPNPARLWYGLAFFVAFSTFWTMRLFLRFSRIPHDSSAAR